MPVIGKAPLTVVRLLPKEGRTAGSRVNVTSGSIVPDTADPEDVARLLEEGYLVEIELIEEPDQESKPEVEPDPNEDPNGESTFELVDGTIEEIEDDLEKHEQDENYLDLVEAYLEAEKAEGGKNRVTLIETLQSILDEAHEADEHENGQA